MTTLKKIWKFLCSMRFAILLLVVLAIGCSVGSLITQGQSYDWYAQRYSERTAALIIALGLDDAFHSAWLLAIAAFLCLNLLLCNVLRLPRLVRRTRAEGRPDGALRSEGDACARGVADPKAVFARLRMPAPVSCADAEGREALFASKHRPGLWGAWVCHLGILLLILGFTLGQATQKQYTVYGVPGDSKPVGDTGYVLSIDDFRIDLNPDGSAAQYTSDITLVNTVSAGPAGGGASIGVNHPASLCGMKFYQNSVGWAATVNVDKSGEPLQRQVLCAGEALSVADKPDLTIFFNAFYPDYVLESGAGPTSLSNRPDNPAYLYSVYYQGRMLGMNALMADEELTIDEYTVTFSEPQNYTLIQVKVDRFTWLALLGGLTTLLGLLLAFYLQPARVWAIREADGSWTMRAACRKGGALFREQFDRAVGGRR